jgi:hypothetical protein
MSLIDTVEVSRAAVKLGEEIHDINLDKRPGRGVPSRAETVRPRALLAFIDFTAWSASASEKGETKALRSGVGALEYRAVTSKFQAVVSCTPRMFL